VGDGQAAWQRVARPVWVGLAVTTLTVWLVATILSLVLPVVETGSDPTRLLMAAMARRSSPPC
jgi:hypothetical protein